MGGFLIIVVVVAVVLIIAMSKSRTKPKAETGTLVIPEDMKVKKTEVQVREKQEHVQRETVRIYYREEPVKGWCCTNCECENPYSSRYCCVCSQERE